MATVGDMLGVTNTGKPTFQAWEARVDARLRIRLDGFGLMDIEDQPTRDMYDSGMSTREAADAICETMLDLF